MITTIPTNETKIRKNPNRNFKKVKDNMWQGFETEICGCGKKFWVCWNTEVAIIDKCGPCHYENI